MPLVFPTACCLSFIEPFHLPFHCLPPCLCRAGLVVRGRHWLLLAPRDEAARQRRTLQQELNDPPVLAFGAIPRGVGRWAGRRRMRTKPGLNYVNACALQLSACHVVYTLQR